MKTDKHQIFIKQNLKFDDTKENSSINKLDSKNKVSLYMLTSQFFTEGYNKKRTFKNKI